MGSCVGKHSNIKRENQDMFLPAPIKREQNKELIVKFREHQNNNREDKLSKIYRMSYMSRDFDCQAFDFSDDLCGIVLSYLSFEERLRFECVSKQWQKLIFNGVHRLEYPLNKKLFYPGFDDNKRLVISRKFLRKCHFIEHLKVRPVLDTDVVALVLKNSYHLKSLNLRLDNLKPIRRDLLCRFTENCGQSLQKIHFNELFENQFDSESGLSLLIVYSEYLLNMRSVSVSIDSDKCLQYFILFADIFNERITELKIRLKLSTSYTQLTNTFEQISRFSRLKNICLKLESDSKLELDLRSGAQLLAKNCTELTRVSLELREQIDCSNEILLKSLESLSFVQRLDLKIRSDNIILGSFESLKTFSQLSELNIIYRNLNDDHLIDIHDNCPHLKSIEMKTMDSLSDRALHSLAKLSELEKLRIFCIPYKVYDITDSGVCQLLTNCQKLRDINFECGIRLTQLTFLTLNALADTSPKCQFRFSFCWKRTEEQRQTYDAWSRISAHDLWPELKCLPENLTIVSGEYFVGKCATDMVSAIDKYEKQFSWNPINSNGFDHKLPQRYTNGLV